MVWFGPASERKGLGDYESPCCFFCFQNETTYVSLYYVFYRWYDVKLNVITDFLTSFFFFSRLYG